MCLGYVLNWAPLRTITKQEICGHWVSNGITVWRDNNAKIWKRLNFTCYVHTMPILFDTRNTSIFVSTLLPEVSILTYSMVQSPSWGANCFASSQEIPHNLWNPKVHYRTHKRPPPVPILGQPNPVHIPTSHLTETHPNIFHPSTPRSPQWSVSLRFPHVVIDLRIDYFIVEGMFCGIQNWWVTGTRLWNVEHNTYQFLYTYTIPPDGGRRWHSG